MESELIHSPWFTQNSEEGKDAGEEEEEEEEEERRRLT
jgi:hypothetical protein